MQNTFSKNINSNDIDSVIQKIPGRSGIILFYYIIDNLDSTTNILVRPRLKEILVDTKMTLATLNKSIKLLKVLGIIIETQTRLWVVNPRIYFKGNDTDKFRALLFYDKELKKLPDINLRNKEIAK